MCVCVCVLGKAAADHSAAWAAYYAQYYQQPGGGAMPGQSPSAQPAAPAPTDQNQVAQNTGQPDYTKAWEEYYKKMGESKENSFTLNPSLYMCASTYRE